MKTLTRQAAHSASSMPPLTYAKRPEVGALFVAGSLPCGLLRPSHESAARIENARAERAAMISGKDFTPPVFFGDQPRELDLRGTCHACGAPLVSARWYVPGRGFVIEWNCWAGLTGSTCSYREVR